jgi:HTH-type transcriptional regulator/antitoxin HigA
MAATRSRAHAPAELIPPGETLVEWLDREEMSQAEFARRARLTPKHITQVVKGKVGISPEVAIAFERVTSVPARYWAQLDANYQTAKQRQNEAAALLERLDVVDKFPVAELERRGCIEKTGNKLEKLRALLAFFGVADPDTLEEVWLQPTMYRRSKAFQADAGAVASWLRLAEMQAAQIKTARYDPDVVRRSIDEIRALSRLPGIEWLKPLTKLCASLGIALVIVKELPTCRINGATRWISPDKAMIALSLRHRRNDIFWFTLFHELCHLLKHGKKETFVDGTDTIDQGLEDEADAYAARVLIPPKAAAKLPGLTKLNDVQEFAKSVGVADGIVVGRMQHDRLIPHSQWTTAFVRYKFGDDRP